MFLNLSNHPVSTWSLEQLEAARELGFGEPRDVTRAGGMPLVPPEADSDEVTALARSLADEAEALGVRGAFVSGEPTLTVALVDELRARGVRCFAATTARVARETTGADGGVHKESVFRFVRWREFG